MSVHHCITNSASITQPEQMSDYRHLSLALNTTNDKYAMSRSGANNLKPELSTAHRIIYGRPRVTTMWVNSDLTATTPAFS